jgi:hypothetical protein
MYNDPIFNEGLAALGRGGFHLLRGRIFFHWFWQGKFSIKTQRLWRTLRERDSKIQINDNERQICHFSVARCLLYLSLSLIFMFCLKYPSYFLTSAINFPQITIKISTVVELLQRVESAGKSFLISFRTRFCSRCWSYIRNDHLLVS